MELRMYKYRTYPSRKQNARLINSLKTCKQIYNELLALSIDSYKFGNVTINKFDYNNFLKGKFMDVHSQVVQNVSDRVHKAFANFFRRVKDNSCKKKGFPRFKSRVNSITFPQSGFKFISNKHIKVSKIGNLLIILHRVPKGKIKTLTIKQNKSGQWFAIFSCEVDIPQINHPSTEKVGIDVGLESFATLSNGEFVSNPIYLVKSEKRIKVLQRRLSRKVKGSANRRKARFRLAKQHIKVANQRSDFLHKLSHRIAKSFAFIAIEDLKVANMVRNHHLAKSISDASWSFFFNCLSYKAVMCGGKVEKVNPRNTSKTCSKCGSVMEINLSQREFLCYKCGFACHRDLNASVNILMVGTDCSEPNACGDSTSTTEQSVASGIVEAGTIFNNS